MCTFNKTFSILGTLSIYYFIKIRLSENFNHFNPNFIKIITGFNLINDSVNICSYILKIIYKLNKIIMNVNYLYINMCFWNLDVHSEYFINL